MKINFQAPPKHLDEKMVYNILRDYKMLNAEVLFRDDEGGLCMPIKICTTANMGRCSYGG